MGESQNKYSRWKKADKNIPTARKFRGTQSKSVMAKGWVGRGRVGRGMEEREFKEHEKTTRNEFFNEFLKL